ncbi:hypothetical protein PDIDSM_5936 [Penicillium digitatum]|nr:hypothetical protein PDIDSM_5936 [Penicillium digitatum]
MVQLCGPRSTPSIQAWDGTLIQTGSVIEDEVFAQTKLKPVSCRASRHGASPTNHNITWVISFLSPVAPFTLFSCSSVARAILKKPQIQHHNPGCQSYCHAARCNRTPRCSNCAAPTNEHNGPSGANCTNPVRCANCHGPRPSGHTDCPVRPSRTAKGTLSFPSRAEVDKFRRYGDRWYRDAHSTPTPPQNDDTSPTAHTSKRKVPGSGRTVSKLSLGRPGKQPLKATSRGRRLAETTSPHLAPKSLSRHKRWTRARRVRPSVPREVLVFWANVRRQTACHTTALQLAYESACDVVCIQEPYVSAPTKKTGHPAYDCYAPTDEWDSSDPTSFESERPRVLTYVRKNSGLNAQQHRSSQDRDLLWVNVNGFLILNIYRQPTTDKVIDYWSSDSGLDFIGEPGVPTHQAGHVLDLTFSNIPYASTVVREDLATGSDHESLVTRIPVAAGVPESKLPKLSSLIGTGIRSLPDPSSIETHDQLDQFAATLTALFQDAIKTAGSLNRTHTFTTPWWTSECQAKRQQWLGSFSLLCTLLEKAYWRDRIDNIKTDSDLYNIISWHKLGTDLKALPFSSMASLWRTPWKRRRPYAAQSLAVLAQTTTYQRTLSLSPQPPAFHGYNLSQWKKLRLHNWRLSTSPGSDRITVRLKACWEHLKDIVLSLFNRCLALCHIPLAWKVARTNHREKNCLDCPHPRRPQPQHAGALPKLSATDLVASFTHDAEMALSQNKQVTLVTMDVQGAFDALLRRRLLKRMGEQGWPRELLLLVDSFLTGRKARVRLEGSTTPDRTPQYGPNAPFRYADDLALYRASHDLTQNVRLLAKDVQSILAWGEYNKVAFAPEKLEMIHITRHRGDESPSIVVNDRLTIDPVQAKKPGYTPTLRWLGVFFDRKLTWRSHILAGRARHALSHNISAIWPARPAARRELTSQSSHHLCYTLPNVRN